MGTTRITADPGLPFIDMERDFAAPRELLYRAHTDPELLIRWLGPNKYRMTVDRFDVRDGGTWRYVHADDEHEHGFHGVFHGAPSMDGIVQTFEYEGYPGHVSLERLTFEDVPGGTRIQIRSVFQSVEDRDGMIESGMETGLNEGYARLDDLVDRLAKGG